MGIGIFLVGFFLGGFCGLFAACMAAAGKLADERTKQIRDLVKKEETDHDG